MKASDHGLRDPGIRTKGVKRGAFMLRNVLCMSFYPLVAGTEVQRNSRVVALSWRALWIFSRNKLGEDDIIRVVPYLWHIKSAQCYYVGQGIFCILYVIVPADFIPWKYAAQTKTTSVLMQVWSLSFDDEEMFLCLTLDAAEKKKYFYFQVPGRDILHPDERHSVINIAFILNSRGQFQVQYFQGSRSRVISFWFLVMAHWRRQCKFVLTAVGPTTSLCWNSPDPVKEI